MTHGRGQGRGLRNKLQGDRKHARQGSIGSSMCSTLTPGRRDIIVPHNIPYTAKLPQQETIGFQAKTAERQVMGDKVMITQDINMSQARPQILVLTDQMMERVLRPDKYMQVLAMVGYTMNDYLRDVQDELIDLSFPFVVIYIGTMQLGVFEPKVMFKESCYLVEAIRSVSPEAKVIITGPVPHPMDHPRS